MTRNQKVLMAGVILVAAASSFGARAADQGADGSYPQYVVDASEVSTDPRYVVDAPDVPAYQLDIVDPANQATIFNNNGDVLVRVTVVPDLANGDQVELLVDGVPAAEPGTALEFPLTGLVRGTHMLQARIIDSSGNVGSISPSSTIYVWEASRLFPNRRVHK
jgi:hypothetical protein